VLVLAVSVMAGCASKMVSQKRVEQKLPAGSRVGVLPFENLTDSENAAEIVTSYFNQDLLAESRWRTVDYGEVYEGMRKLRIRSISTITREQLKSLGEEVGIDYVLAGSVTEYEEHDNHYLGRLPLVSFVTRLVNCSSGETVWVATQNGRGDEGEILFGIGAVRSAENLSRRMVQNAVNEISGLFERK
jgi:TolB-like protein